MYLLRRIHALIFSQKIFFLSRTQVINYPYKTNNRTKSIFFSRKKLFSQEKKFSTPKTGLPLRKKSLPRGQKSLFLKKKSVFANPRGEAIRKKNVWGWIASSLRFSQRTVIMPEL
jgi:hypothetical protein